MAAGPVPPGCPAGARQGLGIPMPREAAALRLPSPGRAVRDALARRRRARELGLGVRRHGTAAAAAGVRGPPRGAGAGGSRLANGGAGVPLCPRRLPSCCQAGPGGRSWELLEAAQ